MNKLHLSIVIPAYNEALRIERTLESLSRHFANKPLGLIEIIVVDDGSPDNTVEVVTAWTKKIPYLKLITLHTNKGKGTAVRVGMQNATGALRLFMDADNSVDISHLDSFLPHIQSGYDVVIGSISLPSSHISEHNGLHRRLLSKLSKMPIMLLATPGIHDTQRGFKLFSEKASEIIFKRQTIERFGFDIELLVIARAHRLKIKEIAVDWDNPAGSSIRLYDYVRTLKELFMILGKKYRGAYGGVSKVETHIVPFTADEVALKGRGFTYKGKEFENHSDLHHSKTALYQLLPSQTKLLITVALVVAGFFLLNWHITLIVLFSTLTLLYFIDLLFNAFLIYRSFSTNPELSFSKEEIAALREDELPQYTVFCPLYKEWQIVPQFVEAMEKLDYPKEKLQIMFLLESNDMETIEKVRGANLPNHYEMVVVPHSFPKTKPKAMNFALDQVRGEFVVIYDAEDIPEPNQLKKAVLAFKQVPATTVCVQAKLNFYNPHQNILTRIFTAEYSLWFDLVLPGLQSLNAPIPLGGTSNHFKIGPLRELNGWDAFNVTEDCDLGLRLAKKGYRTAIVDSTTYEEANSDVLNWYNQRSRWIKGYIQTYFVHMRELDVFSSKRAFWDFVIFQLTVGGKITSMFINPFMWIITIIYFAFRAQTGTFIESLFPGPILYIGVFSLVFGNFLYLYYYMIGCAKRGYDGLIKYVFIVPFYWIGMSIAAWKALYEVIVKPHHWSKTVHGLHLPKIHTASDDMPPDSIPA